MSKTTELTCALDYIRTLVSNKHPNGRVVTYYDTRKTHRRYKIACYGIHSKHLEITFSKIKSVFEVMWPEYEVSLYRNERAMLKYNSIVVKVSK